MTGGKKTDVRRNPVIPTSAYWSGLQLSNPEQQAILNLFRGYEVSENALTGENLLEDIRESLFIEEFTRLEVVVNYEICKRIRNFLEGHDVELVRDTETGPSIFKRVLATIWPGEELKEKRFEASELLNGFKRGDIHLSPRQAF